MRSCCKQVKEFLDYGRSLHGEIRAYYDSLNEHTDKERLKMLLDYLSRHEHRMEESLRRFEQISRQEILAVWLEHVPRMDVQEIIDQCAFSKEMSLEDIISIAIRFDDAQVNLYREVANRTEDARVKTVFNNIVSMEENEKNQMLRNASMLREM